MEAASVGGLTRAVRQSRHPQSCAAVALPQTPAASSPPPRDPPACRLRSLCLPRARRHPTTTIRGAARSRRLHAVKHHGFALYTRINPHVYLLPRSRPPFRAYVNHGWTGTIARFEVSIEFYESHAVTCWTAKRPMNTRSREKSPNNTSACGESDTGILHVGQAQSRTDHRISVLDLCEK
jgi:hypothetical protein